MGEVVAFAADGFSAEHWCDEALALHLQHVQLSAAAVGESQGFCHLEWVEMLIELGFLAVF